MPHAAPQLPNEIYHRLYWYVKRNVDPVRIAASMALSLKTVNHFINRFKAEKDLVPPTFPAADSKKPAAPVEGMDFLDVFVFSKTRHSIIDISGSVDKKNADKLKEMLLKTKASHRNPVALKMTDVITIDNIGAETILSLYREFKLNEHYFAILDPSAAIEPALKQYGIDGTIPIFGTEIAFEEHAFH
jgi:anti-anti-sigma factor